MVKTIMVVDDNADVITSIKYGLEGITDEFQVIGADSGKQCLSFLLQNKIPDLILLDIMMPEMNGWETFNKLKENKTWKKIPVVFLTARIDNIAKNAGRFLGEDYIEKPFEIQDVKNRISKVLEKKVSQTS
jgi:two-component system response regulator VicR